MTGIGRYAVLLIVGLLASGSLWAAEVAGVHVADQGKSGNTELILNGAGVRTKVFFKVYVGALYVAKKTGNASAVIESREPRRVVLYLLRDLSAEQLFDALLDGLKKNLNDVELAALKPDTDQFERIMRGIGNAKTGDIVAIDFSANGAHVMFNDQARGGVADDAFGRALLKVWLGDKPADDDLKRAMLGG